MKKITQIEVIAFDADDTLWVNETFFRDAEAYFCDSYPDAKKLLNIHT